MDQKLKYSSKGVQVEFVNDEQESHHSRSKILQGEIQLVYISPESAIQNPLYRNMFLSPKYKEKLAAIAVDEAHCVKTWGDDFRTVFSQIGELCSLIPTGVSMVALTATATEETLDIVCRRLSMENPVVVALPPYRDNITYQLLPKVDLDQFTTVLCSELNTKRHEFPKTILYIRTYSNCIEMYTAIRTKLGTGFTEPPGYPNISGHRIIEMYTRVLTGGKKEEVMANFAKLDGVLRVVLATTAFGMRVDIPDIHQIIHWGLPSTMEEYVQETGRCGRDGKRPFAIAYMGNKVKNASHLIKQYETNNSLCRRRLLFRGFLMYSENCIQVKGCKCCDVCGMSCECSDCI